MPKPVFPAHGGFLQAVRESSHQLRKSSGIQITEDSIARLLESESFTTSFQRVSLNHGLAMPLNFSSPLAELNLLAILSLLNFGSGFRVPLHKATGRGAWDNMRMLVFGLYISSSAGDGDLVSANGLKTIPLMKIAELLRVDVHTERQHESIPGVTVGEMRGPMYNLVKLITDVLNETGSLLVERGYPDLGTFVVECLKESQKNGDDAADTVLESLVRALPGFQDMALVNETPIYCFKKALFLIHSISIRFGSLNPRPFPVPSTSHLPVFTDNVLPSLLVHLGVLDITSSPSLSSHFTEARDPETLASLLGPAPESGPKQEPIEGPVLSASDAYMLRGAAIDACEMIVASSRKLQSSPQWVRELKLPELDMWLWAVAKDRVDYRQLPRFAQRDTVFF